MRVRTINFLMLLVIAGACHRELSSDDPPGTPSSSQAAPTRLDAELVTFSSGPLTLSGYLFRPTGPGPFPAIVFNHGSENDPGPKRDQARFYVLHGYVLFVPHRRGQGLSTAAGPDINSFDATAPDFVDALVTQSDDVMAAVAYVESLPYVDPFRVATVGCSLGGIEALLAAERGTGLVAAVDFAGAAITWAKNEPLQARMKLAATRAKVPVLFIQAENDYDTRPSRVLSEEMKRAGKPMRVHVFPPNGETPREGHGFCLGGRSPAWGDEVLAFLADAMHP
jgi:carboxymethylenebutenolidase